MKESREVKDLRGKILGIELELNIISKDLKRFKNELLCNKQILKAIRENIEFLRTSNAAVSLSEFKKIKQHEKLVKTRIKYYETKTQPLGQILNRKEGFHKQEMKRFEKIYRMQFTNNLLEFPSDRRKKG